MSDYILTIGCEIHTELKTRSKMFSSAPAQIDQECVPNTLVNEIDLGLPGTLPAPNEHGVVLAIKLAKALKMEIDPNLIFDRKNYFYRDLPKGYQITQQYFPIGKNGSLAIDNGQVIAIERIHIEEDTCKQTKEGDVIKLDYNRAGVPLIEIVSKPVIHSKNDCIKYLEKLRAILTHLDISDGKMENGSLRVDLNISVSNNEHLGTKVEIKNINSFNNVGQAIDYEFQRQVALLTKNEKVDQATRRWDDVTKTTIFMRAKADAIGYRYFTEPNIININIQKLIDRTQLDEKTTPDHIRETLLAQKINRDLVDQLVTNHELYRIYDYVNKAVNDPALTVTWIVIELVAKLRANNVKIENVDPATLDHLISLIKLIKQQRINGKQAKVIFEKVYNEKVDPLQIVETLNVQQISDDNHLKTILEKLIADNQTVIKDYPTRPERVEKFLLGGLMKETKGQANPVLAKKILDELLKGQK